MNEAPRVVSTRMQGTAAIGRNTRHELSGNGIPLSTDDEITAFFGGARFAPWSSIRVEPFAEILVGGRHERFRVVELGDPEAPFRFDSTVELTDPALQPGGGIVLWLHRRVGVQAAVHYRRTVGRSADGLELPEIDEWRFGAGLTVGF